MTITSIRLSCVACRLPGPGLDAPAQLEAVPLADAPETPAERERWAEPHMVKFRRGLISAAAGRDDRAVIALREAVDLEPAFAPGWLNLGHALMRLSRLRELDQRIVYDSLSPSIRKGAA